MFIVMVRARARECAAVLSSVSRLHAFVLPLQQVKKKREKMIESGRNEEGGGEIYIYILEREEKQEHGTANKEEGINGCPACLRNLLIILAYNRLF